MDILESFEVRWFFAVADPTRTEIENWFQAVPVENDDRKDYYYVDSQRPDLNAKERTGGVKSPKLEFKYRVGLLGDTRLTANIVGQVERWTKLSVDGLAATVSSYSRGIEVKKSRRLRKFSFSVAGEISEVAVKDRPEAGCGVEFTQIQATCKAQTKQAYTFGLEAFGPPLVSLEVLQGALRALIEERPSLRLSAAQSMNYSSWLLSEFPEEKWTHRTIEDTPYFDHPAQARPPSGSIPSGTLCRIVSGADSHVRIATNLGVSGYVSESILAPL